MADKKISDLPENPGLVNTALLEVEQDGSSYQATAAEFLALLTLNVDQAVTDAEAAQAAAAAAQSAAETAQADALASSANAALNAGLALTRANNAATSATAAASSATAAASSQTAAASSATAAAASEAAAAATAAGIGATIAVLTSTTSNTLGTGSKTWSYTSTSNLAWRVGDRLKVFRTSAPTYYVIGAITSVSTTSVTITADIQLNNGTFTDWTLQLVMAGGVPSLPGAGANSEIWGYGAVAAGSSGTAFGNTASAGGSSSVAFGRLSTAGGTDSTALGFGATASATYATAIGSGATSSGSGQGVAVGRSVTASGFVCVAIGTNITVSGSSSIGIGTGTAVNNSVVIGMGVTHASTESSSIVIGQGAKVSGTVTTGGFAVAIGQGAEATSWRNTIVGAAAKGGAVSTTAVGYGAISNAPHGVAIGRGAYVPSGFDNAVVLGYNGGNAATDVYFDSGIYSHFTSVEGLAASNARTTSSCPVRINGMAGRDAAAVTGNLSGGDLELCGGQSTGTGNGGSVHLRTALAGSSGTSLNARVTMFSATALTGLEVYRTITAAGTTGAQTINKPSGTVNIAAGQSSLVVTNSMVTANSIVLCTIRTNDSTADIKNVVPASGSFTIRLNANATAETSVGFLVLN